MIYSNAKTKNYYSYMRRKVKMPGCAVLISALCWLPQLAGAQASGDPADGWYLGVGTGVQFSSMRFSDLDKDRYPTSESLSSPVWSLFAQKEIGDQKQYVVRPHLSFLKRGGKLTEIGRFSGYADPDLVDVNYRLESRFVDFRIPLLYQFNQAESTVRPYVGLTPILGFSTGGHIRMQAEYEDCSIEGYKMELNKNNFASSYLAVAPTVGVRINFHLGRNGEQRAFLNLEAGYEIGLSDTYSSKEKDGKAKNVVGRSNIKFDGTRKFSGLGLQAMIGIPLSVFKRKKAEVPVVYGSVVETPQPKVQPEPEKPCYTLEEISELIAQNKSVRGKTICAISDINFDFGKSTLQAQSYPYLNQLAEMIVKMNCNIKVKGHTDNVGTDDFNLKLSRQRAEAVMKYLIKRGVDKDKISYTYYGASKPLSSNETEEGRTMNRRVEFEIEN